MDMLEICAWHTRDLNIHTVTLAHKAAMRTGRHAYVRSNRHTHAYVIIDTQMHTSHRKSDPHHTPTYLLIGTLACTHKPHINTYAHARTKNAILTNVSVQDRNYLCYSSWLWKIYTILHCITCVCLLPTEPLHCASNMGFPCVVPY